MSKNEFLSILANGLKDFPEKELADIIFDYQEHFTVGLSNGKTEEEIIDELGNPYELVYQYRSAYLEKVQTNEDTTSSYTEDDTKFYGDVKYETVSDEENTKESKEDPIEDSKEKTFEDTEDYKYNFSKEETENKKDSRSFKNFSFSGKVLIKFILIVIALIFLAPLALGAGACAIGLFIAFVALLGALIIGGLAISVSGILVILSKIGIVVIGASSTPAFITDFPNSVIILFIIGSLSLTALLAMLSYYLIKWVLFSIINLFKKTNKGGTQYEKTNN